MWVFSVVENSANWEDGVVDPQLAEALLGGAEFLSNYLGELSANPHMAMPHPLTCNICDRMIQPWFFEKHTALCIVSHKAESEVQDCHDHLRDQRQLITGILEDLENSSTDVVYHGVQISESVHTDPSEGQRYTTQEKSNREQVKKQRTSNVRVVEILLDYCDLAIDINTPAIPEDDGNDVFGRIQSPDSQIRISQVQEWEKPTIENPGLDLLCQDLYGLVSAKLAAITRLHNTIHYSEIIRQEIDARVQTIVDETAEGALTSETEELTLEESEAQRGEEADDETLSRLSQYNDANLTGQSVAPAGKLAADASYNEEKLSSAPLGLSDIHSYQVAPPARHISSYSDLAIDHEPRASSPLSLFPPLSQRDQETRSLSSLSVALQRPISNAGSSEQGIRTATNSRRNSPQDLESQIRDVRMGRGIYESPRRPSTDSRTQGSSPSRRGSRAGSRSRALSIARDRAHSPGRKVLGARLNLLDRDRLSPSASPTLSAAESSSTDTSFKERRTSMGPPLSPRLPSIAPAARPAPPSIKDFEIIKPISRGAFGSVYLSKKRTTGDYYAIKVLKKADMIAKNQVTNIKAERAIMMAQTESPFIAKLYFTFQSKDYLYLVMEYLNGGDCAALIKQLGGLPEDWTRRYMAEVVLGLEYLHSRGIVHRDLKPDNLLISHNGHLKLTDFGLSRVGLVGRQNRARTSSHPETPEFLNTGVQNPLYHRSGSPSSSRSASFDFVPSGLSTPAIAPIAINDPRSGYFNVRNRKVSQGEPADSGKLEMDNFTSAVSKLNLDDSKYDSDDGASTTSGHSSTGLSFGKVLADPHSRSPSVTSSALQMPPPAMKLFDPKDSQKKFVGTPDYLAPETIDGSGQDDMVDWWSLGVIMFEFLYGYPPFHASSPDAVFDNILNRRIAWPDVADEAELNISEPAKSLVNCLMTISPSERLGSVDGAADIKRDQFFEGISWERISEEEALFVPTPDHPEDTEYFDARGATNHVFEDESEILQSNEDSSSASERNARPSGSFASKSAAHNRQILRGPIMPLSIPAHVRDRSRRSRRLSESGKDEFGSFTFKNLSMLEKQNLEALRRLRSEQSTSSPVSAARDQSMAHHARSASLSICSQPLRKSSAMSGAASSTPISPTNHNSFSRNSIPNSPLIPSSPSITSRHRTRGSISVMPTSVSSDRSQTVPEQYVMDSPVQTKPHANSLPLPDSNPSSPRNRAFTVGAQPRPELPFSWQSAKRIPRVFEPDTPSSSSDNEASSGAKALQRVQRRRSRSNRLSSISVTEALRDVRVQYALDILICEDNPVSRKVLEAMLTKLKCRVVSVTDGAQAVAAATGDVVFDVIFTDIKVPRLSGIEVARLIKSSAGSNAVTPIVAMSSYSTSELRDMAHIFEKRLEKPLTIKAITETVQQLVGSWAPPAYSLRKT